MSTQTPPPLAHVMPPVLQGLGFEEHGMPDVHATHEPEPLQTSFVPQVTPGPVFVVPSSHAEAPVEHPVTPALQTFGLPVQTWPATHEVQTPDALQTRFVPQLVPGARLVVVLTQTGMPEPHCMTPVLQGSGLVVHAMPTTHALQSPCPSQTFPLAQARPASAGAPSPQCTLPPVHDVVPKSQTLGFVLHGAPTVQAMQFPFGSQTLFMAQGVPPGRKRTSSTQLEPVPHS